MNNEQNKVDEKKKEEKQALSNTLKDVVQEKNETKVSPPASNIHSSKKTGITISFLHLKTTLTNCFVSRSLASLQRSNKANLLNTQL